MAWSGHFLYIRSRLLETLSSFRLSCPGPESNSYSSVAAPSLQQSSHQGHGCLLSSTDMPAPLPFKAYVLAFTINLILHYYYFYMQFWEAWHSAALEAAKSSVGQHGSAWGAATVAVLLLLLSNTRERMIRNYQFLNPIYVKKEGKDVDVIFLKNNRAGFRKKMLVSTYIWIHP